MISGSKIKSRKDVSDAPLLWYAPIDSSIIKVIDSYCDSSEYLTHLKLQRSRYKF